MQKFPHQGSNPCPGRVESFFFLIDWYFGYAGSLLLHYRLSLVADSRGYSLVALCRLLIVMASLDAACGLRQLWLKGLAAPWQVGFS